MSAIPQLRQAAKATELNRPTTRMKIRGSAVRAKALFFPIRRRIKKKKKKPSEVCRLFGSGYHVTQAALLEERLLLCVLASVGCQSKTFVAFLRDHAFHDDPKYFKY